MGERWIMPSRARRQADSIVAPGFNDARPAQHGDRDAVRLCSGKSVVLIKFNHHRDQVGLHLTRHDQDQNPTQSILQPKFWSDYLEKDMDHLTFVVSTKGTLRHGLPCWSLTADIWRTLLGRPDQPFTNRPYI